MDNKIQEETMKFQKNFIERLGEQFKHFLGGDIDNKISEEPVESLDLQQGHSPALEEQLWFLSKDRLLPEELRKKQDNEIERLSQEIEAMQNERDQILARWNQYIEQRTTILNKLKVKVEELKK